MIIKGHLYKSSSNRLNVFGVALVDCEENVLTAFMGATPEEAIENLRLNRSLNRRGDYHSFPTILDYRHSYVNKGLLNLGPVVNGKIVLDENLWE